MTMNERVQAAMGEQIGHELASAYFYLSATGYFEAINLTGFARWMRLQAQEEVAHAMKFFDFINDRGGRAALPAIPAPPADFQSPLDAFTRALEHEQTVTGLINALYTLAVQEEDYPAQVLLQWFITEQVEEEKSATTMMEELKLVGSNTSALLLLNNEAGARQADAE
jgi:ferritin